VDAHTLGQLIYLFEVQTAISGELYKINAFDQPGVEAGKINAYAMMGRSGYEDRRKEIDERPPRDERFVV
jgi:glucose-6-phosphate isomerase